MSKVGLNLGKLKELREKLAIYKISQVSITKVFQLLFFSWDIAMFLKELREKLAVYKISQVSITQVFQLSFFSWDIAMSGISMPF